jgi:hypothetical protein
VSKIGRADDTRSVSRTTILGKSVRSLTVMNRRRMKRRILISALLLGLLVVAVVGWTAQGVRHAFGGRGGLAPAT